MSKKYSIKALLIISEFNSGSYFQQALKLIINKIEYNLKVKISDYFSTDNTVAIGEDVIKNTHEIIALIFLYKITDP